MRRVGTFRKRLGSSWACFGTVVEASWGVCEPIWRLPGTFYRFLNDLKPSLRVPEGAWRSLSWRRFGSVLGSLRTVLGATSAEDMSCRQDDVQIVS